MSRAIVQSSLNFPLPRLLSARSVLHSLSGDVAGDLPATTTVIRRSITTVNWFCYRGLKNPKSKLWKSLERTDINLRNRSAIAQVKMESSVSAATTATAADDLTAAASATNNSNTSGSSAEEVLVQYVVLRRDLIDTWPLGSVVTQGCHASVAAIWSHKEDPHTLQYCSPANLNSMHKVTLEVKGETQIMNLSEKLKQSGIDHKLWIEQPENIPTCLATKPYPKSLVSSLFKKLKLCK